MFGLKFTTRLILNLDYSQVRFRFEIPHGQHSQMFAQSSRAILRFLVVCFLQDSDGSQLSSVMHCSSDYSLNSCGGHTLLCVQSLQPAFARENIETIKPKKPCTEHESTTHFHNMNQQKSTHAMNDTDYFKKKWMIAIIRVI